MPTSTWLLLAFVMVSPALARAQQPEGVPAPTPAKAPSPLQPEGVPPPTPSTPTSPAQPVETAVPADDAPLHPTTLAGQTLDDDYTPGDPWPDYAMDGMRGLPRCAADAVPPRPGQEFTCRPPLDPRNPQLGFGIEVEGGMADGNADLSHNAFSFGFWGDYAFLRHLALTTHVQFVRLGRLGGEDAAAGGMNLFMAGLRGRFFTDETERDAWALSASGGIALMGGSFDGTEPVARLSLSREIGAYFSPRSAGLWGLELSLLQSFGDVRIRSVLAGLRMGIETGIREPKNIRTDWEPPSASYISDVGLMMGVGSGGPLLLGFAYAAGLPIGDHLDVRGRADMMIMKDAGMYSALAGSRARFGWPRLAPAYLEAMAGYGLVHGDPGAFESGPIADFEVGLRLHSECHLGLDLGVRTRHSIVDEGLAVRSGFVTLTMVFGREVKDRFGHTGCRFERAVAPIPYVAPVIEHEPSTQPAPAPTEAVVETTPVEVDVHAEVALEPVEIEVVLGASLFGGSVRIEIDPRLIPWDRLVAAGVIDVQLLGPRSILHTVQTDLTMALGQRAVTVRSWRWQDDGKSTVRARFTLFPRP